MMNDDNNDGDHPVHNPQAQQQQLQQQQQQRINPHGEVRRIQDLDHYLQQNGLGHSNSNNSQDPTEDQRELASRIEEAESYKKDVLRGFLEMDEMDELDKEKEQIEERRNIVNSCLDAKMFIVTPMEKITLTLATVVAKCDTIYALVKSDQWLPAASCTNESKSNNDTSSSKKDNLSFSLIQFQHDSIIEFISLLQETKPIHDVHPDRIIECCKIAHYLQCDTIFLPIVDIIQESIDKANCASICLLADQLQIASLLNSSMEYVMDSLDKIQSHDIWNDFPESLQHHLLTLRNAAQSSIIGKGHKAKVMFTSSNEFLAIFSDTLREHKDRLYEAKLRQREIIQQRKRLNESRGRYAQEIDIYGGDVQDAARKIEKQEIRVQTLEIFYREQKEIFSKDANRPNSSFESQFEL